MEAKDDLFNKKEPDNSTEKCRTLLANLLELSTNESKAIESEVRKLTQGLIIAEVEPEDYCTKLERLLHASPQPLLIDFLQKTLPMLRQALVTKELVIEGIDPPVPRSQVSDTAHSAVQDAGFTDMNSTKKKSKHLQKKPVSRKMKPGKVVKTKGGKNKDKRKLLDLLFSSNDYFDDVAPVQSLDERKAERVAEAEEEAVPEEEPEEEAEAAEPHVVGDTSVDDDINDVVTMAGVDVAEEHQNLLRSTKKINAKGRHSKLPEEKHFLNMDALRVRINSFLARYGLRPPLPNVARLVDYAVTEKIKNILVKLIQVTKARYAQPYMMQDGCEITGNVKAQLDFLRDVDMCNQKRAERERAKARQADPDAQQVQRNEEAKERDESELETRQGENTQTATEAVGGRSGEAQEGDAQGSGADSSADAGPSTSASAQGDGDEQPAKGPMIATMRDLIFVLEQDKDFARSPLLYSLYLYQ